MSQIRAILNQFNINGHDKLSGTDKDTTHSYVEIYEKLLEPILDKDGSLLEIGIQYGGSVLLWNELLKNFKIFGIDTENKIHLSIQDYISNYKQKIFLEFRDAYSAETAQYIKSIYPRGFDVIIDDGPHTKESQLKFIQLYLELLKDNGMLIIEDVQDINNVNFFIDNIPASDFFDYKVFVFDLRHKKNRYDDILLVINKTIKKPNNQISIFYHVYQSENWKRLFQEQINSLVISGLYHACDFIHIGINGEEILPIHLPKFKIHYNTNKILEADTLKSLHSFCVDNPKHRVLYFHTKGATKDNDPLFVNITKWRYYLEYFTIYRWKNCITALEQHDTAGAEYIFYSGLTNQDTGVTEYEKNPHYAGNYWWANANYISSLNPEYLYLTDKGWTRYRSEFWIGTGNPKYYQLYNTGIYNLYGDWGSLIPSDYVEK